MNAPAPASRTPPGGLPVLMIVRFLTVTNDNLVRWLAVGLGKRAAESLGSSPDAARTLGLIFYIAPFLVFASLAGWLADRLSKRSVIIGGKFAEVLIALVTAAVLVGGVTSGPTVGGLPLGLWLLLGAVGLFGLQSALLNPGLLGIVPEIVPRQKLAPANGGLAVVTLAGTMAGMALGSPLADIARPGGAVGWAEVVAARFTDLPFGRLLPAITAVVGVAVVGWLWSLRLPRVAAANPGAAVPWNMLRTTAADLAFLWRSPRLAAAAGGIVYFWALGAVVQINIDAYKDESGGQTQAAGLPLLVALLIGIAIGSLLAGWLSRRGIEAGSKVDLGFVPFGGVVMTIACLALAVSSPRIFGPELDPAIALVAPMAWLGLLGIGAGLFDVPLEAYLQEQSPPERRGAVLASTNLLVFAGMLVASTAYYGLRLPIGPAEAARPWLSARGIFGLFALLSVAATGVAVWAAPRATLRFVVGGIVGTVWRFRVRGEADVPTTGPLVIVANHLSWLDGFLLPLAAPRPVRMVVYGPNIQGRFLNMLADQWRFILFDPKPKSIGRALKAIQGGLADGDCVGIFCEGGISRTGQILGFKRGLEWLLERVESPILPASIDGMWGSLLSYSEGRYFTKWPRGLRRTVTLTFGTPLPVGTPTDLARLALQELTATVVRRRMAGRRPPRGFTGDWAAACAEAEAFEGACLLRREDRLVASLAAGDPLGATLGAHGSTLLGIETTAADAAGPPGGLARTLAATRATVWLARVEQVEALAAERADASGLADHLVAIVMPIAAAVDLPWARHAAERFRKAHGIEPVVAYCPREAGCLVAMNTPPARGASEFEVTHRPESLGRVLNGGVVWPRASLRPPLGRPSLASAGVPDDADATLVISALIPCPAAGSAAAPAARLLADALAVDKEGFLILRDPTTAGMVDD